MDLKVGSRLAHFEILGLLGAGGMQLPASDVFFDVSHDGQRFLLPAPVAAATGPPPFKVVLNWTSTLK